jgi:hypothetical protein
MIAEERTSHWLNTLRNPESPVLGLKPKPAGTMKPGGREGYREAHEQLLELQGVGPKVADCVCLMGLGWGEAVPVDTHGRVTRIPPPPATADSLILQYGRLPNEITNSEKGNTEASRKLRTMLLVTTSAAYGARKLAGHIPCSLPLICEPFRKD